MSSLRRLFSLMGPYRGQLAVGLVCVAITTCIGLLFPLVLESLIDGVIGSSSADTSLAIERLNSLVATFITLYGARWLFQYLNTYLVSQAGFGTVRIIRGKAYSHLMRLSMEYYEMRTTGDAISRVTNDVTAVQNGISNCITDFVFSVFSLLGVVVAIFLKNWRLATLTVFVIPAVGFLVGKFGDKIRAISNEVQMKLSDITAILQETVSGIAVIKAFSAENKVVSAFQKRNDENFSANMRGVRLLAILFPAVEVILAIGVLIVIFVGGHLVINRQMTSGELVAFITYLALATTPASTISRTYSSIQSALAAADRIYELLDAPVSVHDRDGAVEMEHVDGRVVFEEVGFSYKVGQPVFREVSFEVLPGEVIAILGPSGAGKTSLVNLIPRFYDVTEGRITVDGVDVRDIRVKSLRSHIGMVLQDNVLFSTSLRENIAYGRPDASDDMVEIAARAANAHNFIVNMPEGYETVVGERGATLSGGQRQRIAIARAILSDPKILILDEATSALDSEAEKSVQEALDRLMKGRTTFIIAHRLTTVRNATRILVLEAGRLVEMGSHSELLAANGVYAKLYRDQFAHVTL